MGKITVGLISNDTVGKKMAGPGIRYVELTRHLARNPQLRVVLVAPLGTDISIAGASIRSFKISSQRSIINQIKDIDVIISQNLKPFVARYAKKHNIIYIADLYDPMIIERMEHFRTTSARRQKNAFEHTYQDMLIQLNYADHILCASEKQKDLYIGILSGLGMITPATYLDDPTLEKFISIVPFGFSGQPIKKFYGDPVGKKFPTIGPDDKVVLWGGGIWSWFDAMSPVRAVEKISHHRQDIKLLFMGVHHPGGNAQVTGAISDILDYCRKRKLLDRCIFFNFGWTPYEERVQYLQRATIGISTHYDNLETRFSFRTRFLDYLWANLPIVCTKGDALADLIERHGLGRVVGYKDINSIAFAIEQLVDQPKLRGQIKLNIAKLKTQFYWSKIVEHLAELILDGKLKSRSVKGWQSFLLLGRFYAKALKERYGK